MLRVGLSGFGPQLPDVEDIDFQKVLSLPKNVKRTIFRHVTGRTLQALEESCDEFRKIIRFGLQIRNVPKMWKDDIWICGEDSDITSTRIYVFIGEKMIVCDTPGILKT